MGGRQRLDHHDPFVSGHRMALVWQRDVSTAEGARLVAGPLRLALTLQFPAHLSGNRGMRRFQLRMERSGAGVMLQ
jgi:hypothetical protein